ncbi:hypothetical protein V2G26_006599 [Clonostachys chloroleuca]
MGKSRRNRANAARRDPIAKPVKPPSDPELAALRESKILPVIKDLQSSDPKSRSAAASAISNIIQDTKCRKLLLREQIVHIIINETLTDAALESRAAGWGILQVIAQEEEADFCVHLYRLDILTAIEHATKNATAKFSSKDTPFSKLPKLEQATTLSIVASILSLITALAEAQDEILETIASNSSLTNFLYSFIPTSDLADAINELRNDALTCLMILSEDNKQLAKTIVSDGNRPVYESLQVLSKETSDEGILACGVLHNVYLSLQGVEVSTELNIVDDSRLIPTLSKAIAEIGSSKVQSNGTGSSNSNQKQELALEIIASIGTTMNGEQGDESEQPEPKPKAGGAAAGQDDEDMDDIDVGVEDDNDNEDSRVLDEDEDDDMDDDEMQADMDMVTGADDADEGESIDDLPILKTLVQKAIPQLVRVVALQAGDEETIKLQALSLSALNNIAWSVSLIDFSHDHNKGIQKTWEPVAKSIWTDAIVPILSSDTADVTLATQVTGLAWAVARTLRDKTPLKINEQRKFISLYQATHGSEATQNSEDPFQGLGVKCIGVLGQLALDPAPADLNREIGTFLLTVLAALPQTPAADAVEALNQLFDVYGDENFACDKEVFWKDNYLKHLEEILPKAKAVAKSVDKRTQSELRARVDEAVLNLSRFIAYKKKSKP